MNDILRERMRYEQFNLVSIDLFSGPGGLCTGFKWAGILPLIAVEWTDTTVETYSLSHDAEVLHLEEYMQDGVVNNDYLDGFLIESARTLIIHGDINLVDNDLICQLLMRRYGIDSLNETVDIVSGGAPCESFSMAGTRTLGDERDDLFSNILRIARAVKTKAILFEYVKGMLSKRNADGVRGAMFQHICNMFEEEVMPSYRLVSREQEDILLRACDYGVPQARERIFLVAINNELENVEFLYPAHTHGPNSVNPYVTVAEAINDLPIVESGEGEDVIKYNVPDHFISINQERYINIMRGDYNEEGLNSYIPNHLFQLGLYNEHLISVHKGPGHIQRKRELLALIPPRSSMKMTFMELTRTQQIDHYRHLFPKTIYGSRNRRLLEDEPSFTVTSHCLDEILHPFRNRAISPREAARLQSFPDWYQFAGPYVQFHGDRVQDKYEQIGDAIPPLLANAIAREFVNCLPAHV